jgi:hypothetical protein
MFTITITETKMVESTATPWDVVEKIGDKARYDYLPPPPRPRMVKSETKVFEQTTEAIDLPAVILAVNRLP